MSSFPNNPPTVPGGNPLDSMTAMPYGTFWDNAQPPAPHPHTAAETRATQTFLRNHGYNITVDGSWGPQTESAARNWRSARNPTVWNRSTNARPRVLPRPGRPQPNTTPVPRPAPQPAPRIPDRAALPSGGVAGTQAPDGGMQGGVDLSSLMGTAPPRTNVGSPLPLGLGNRVGNPLSPALAGVGTRLSPTLAGVGNSFDPRLAGQYAGAEFDPQIQGVQNQINFVPKQTAQNLHDLATWYSQVQASLGGARDAAAKNGADNTAALGNATAGILASLGGGANPGVSGIANEGANQAALAGQTGSIESNFLGEEAPLLQADAAAQSTREQARQQGIARDLLSQQLGLRGQKGARQSELAMQIQEYNNNLAAQRNANLLNIGQYNNGLTQQHNQSLLGIGQYNNSLAQQRGGNALSIREYNNQLAQQNRQNAIDNTNTQAGLALTGAQIGLIGQQAKQTALSAPGRFVPWDRLNPQQQTYMVNQALAQVAPAKGLHGWQFVSPTDRSAAANLKRQQNQQVINQAKMSMRRWFMSQHYNNPRLGTRIEQAVNAAVKTAQAMAAANQKF